MNRRRNFSGSNSAVLTLKRAAESYGTYKRSKADSQGVFDAFLTPLTSTHFFARNKTARKSCGPHGLALGLAAKMIYRNESDVLTGAMNRRRNFSGSNSAVLTLKRAAESYGT